MNGKEELTWLSFFHKLRTGDKPLDQSSLSNFDPAATDRLRIRSWEITCQSINHLVRYKPISQLIRCHNAMQISNCKSVVSTVSNVCLSLANTNDGPK